MAMISDDDWKRLSNRVGRLLDELGLEGRYPEEMKKFQDRFRRMMEDMEIKEEGFLPADILETDEELVITMDLPGIEKEDIELSVAEDQLRVVATRKTAEGGYYQQERTCTRWERSMTLPVSVKADEAKAKLKDGVLQIVLPREVMLQKKRIVVE